MPVIDILPLSSKSTLHGLLWHNELEPCKSLFCQLVDADPCHERTLDVTGEVDFSPRQVPGSPGSCSAVSLALSMISPRTTSTQRLSQLQTPIVQAWRPQSPELAAFLSPAWHCLVNAFLLTPRGKWMSASMTPPCEQPPLYSFGGFVVSSERQPFPVDGFPCHPRVEYRQFCLRLLCHLPIQ